jgi:branched-chain amino acid transport system ATP-binding protein
MKRLLLPTLASLRQVYLRISIRSSRSALRFLVPQPKELRDVRRRRIRKRMTSADISPTTNNGDKAYKAALTALQLTDVDTYYGPSQVLRKVSLTVNKGEIVCLLGANAAGKTTTMKTIFGLVHPRQGTIEFEGERIDRKLPGDIVHMGMALVPEARRIFPRMTVMENLEMGAFIRRNRSEIKHDIDYVCEIFPRLKERLKQVAGTMSGGEQQMLAMGRALMSRPRMVCMDEPSMGLSPILVETVFNTIVRIRDEGVTIFLVEQNASMALSLADRGYVLQTGQIVLSDTAKNLLTNDLVRQAYLGGE